jgi:hypothetical protein
MELYLILSHLHTDKYMRPTDKTENLREEEAAQKVAKHQIASR